MSNDSSSPEVLNALRTLEHAGFKVLAPLPDAEAINPPTDSAKILVMLMDWETTGLDKLKDLPIELGYQVIECDPVNFTFHRVLSTYSGFEDPGIEISEEVHRVTGITNEDVKGQRLDDDKINSDIDRVQWVIAHNADFDRHIGERRFPKLKDKLWSCSLKDGPWEAMGIGPKALEFLAFKVGGFHYEAHRAAVDCQALAHILAKPGVEGQTCLGNALQKATSKSYTIWADRSPFEKKDVLKSMGYRWNGDSEPGKLDKTWYKENVRDLQAELDELHAKVYGQRASVTVDVVSALQRYSPRQESRSRMMLGMAAAAPVQPGAGSLPSVVPAPHGVALARPQEASGLLPARPVASEEVEPAQSAVASAPKAVGFGFRRR